ncbi:MAG: hypothetical protein OSA89_17600, partial [Mariniblastus sp.]|nr:hypothetical protein [Mariniblastus sp.]
MVQRLFVTLICLSLGVSFAAPTATCFGQENEKQTEPVVAVESPADASQEEVLSTPKEAKRAEPKPEISSEEALKAMAALKQEKTESSESVDKQEAAQGSKQEDSKQEDSKQEDSKQEDSKQ